MSRIVRLGSLHTSYRWLRSVYRRVRFALQYPRSVRIDPSSWIARRSVISAAGGGSISIGKNCEIHDYSMLLTYGGDIQIGDDCSINPFTIVYGYGGVSIGSGVRIAAHTVIIPANHNIGDDEQPLLRSGVTASGIKINDHVWIGTGVRILYGVHIGRNAVIGAGSVVTRSIPANSTAVGVPARVIKQR